tara:strand:+ start:1431 stop:1799 length:369 start_codon:yes stop_codon:yes gene_type:complete
MKFFLQLCIILGFPAQAATLEKLEDGNSKICGEVVEVLNPKTSISPYLINFNFSVTRKDNKLLRIVPKFQIVLWQNDATRLSIRPDYAYLGENICVKGMLVDYKGVSQIHLRSLDQIKINKE